MDSIAPESITTIDPNFQQSGEPGSTYVIGYFGEVDGNRRFIVTEEFTSVGIAFRAYKHLAEAPGPDLGFEIAKVNANGRADW